MLTAEQIKMSISAPGLPLSFLLELHDRNVNRKDWKFNDSALFFRLWDLFDAIREPEVFAALTEPQKAAYMNFAAKMNALPWEVIPTHPHIRQLIDDNLEPLKESGRNLYENLFPKAS